MTKLEIDGLRKVFTSKKGDEVAVAVDGVSLSIREGEFFTLLGPSGCGKTTTLRSIAGLETPDEGRITIGDRTVFSSEEDINLESYKRGLGMVFQSYAIWPHMTVLQNVGYPLSVLPRRNRPSKKEITERVRRVLESVQLAHLIDRPATDLSGGQQQRLALARALVAEPPVLLLDEPLSNLDAKLRDETRATLKRLQRRLGVTTIYVTHDQIEALAMSDRIAVMNQGRVEQLGHPEDIYSKPLTRFVSEFIGTANFLTGKVVGREHDTYQVATGHGELLVGSEADHAVGDEVVVSIRPEGVDLRLGRDGAGGIGAWAGTVRTRGFLGEWIDHAVELPGDGELLVRSPQSVDVRVGSEVTLEFDPSACALVAKS